MGYPFFVNLEHSNLTSIFHCSSDVILIFSQQKHLTLEIEPCDFLKIFSRFCLYEPHFLASFSYKKTCSSMHVIAVNWNAVCIFWRLF